jgi:hypothetical protein
MRCVNASAEFPAGTVVSLTAEPSVLGRFQGWTGDCSGDGGCALTMTGDRDVVAHFAVRSGSVSGAPDPGTAWLVQSRLGVPEGRGEVTVNGRNVLAAGQTRAGVALQPGDNVFEAWLRDGRGEGLWRIELTPGAASEAATLGVLAGQPVEVGPTAIVFRLAGRSGERVSFVLRLPRREAPAPYPR